MQAPGNGKKASGVTNKKKGKKNQNAGASSSSVAWHAEAERRSGEINRITAGSGNIIDTLTHRLQKLNEEIKLMKAGEQRMRTDLERLEKRKQVLVDRTKKNQEFVDGFDEKIGPFEARYAGLRDSIGGLYDDAKDKHAAAIQLLVEHFAYHPAFKRWSDEFSAVPFKPM